MITKNGTKLLYKDKDILNSMFQVRVHNKLKIESKKTIKEIEDDTSLKRAFIKEAIKRLRKAEIIILKIENGVKIAELTKYGHSVLMQLNRVRNEAR